MKRYLYIGLAVIVLVIIALLVFTRPGDASSAKITAPVKTGTFEINVTTTGELEAQRSEKIYGPSGLRSLRIWNVEIEDIIPDGSLVDSGQYVATLNRTEISNNIKDLESEVEKLQSQYIQTRLDTSMDLRSSRNALINLKYDLEAKRLKLEQSRYEPPATIRQYEIDVEKAERDYQEAIKGYQLQLEKSRATMQEVEVSLSQERRNLEQLTAIRDEFVIKAPKSGMVIYRRNFDGSKQGVGSTLNTWDNIVATLPDLNRMISKTYVNEIDISRVKIGQQVIIGVDAFPEKKYTGVVTEVANIGEQLSNSNAKVFEVIIVVNESDSIMRPAMTTKNTIITAVIDSVLFIPLEALQSNDSMNYVFTAKNYRQQVITGESNENEIIIRAGLNSDDKVLLLAPENPESYRLVMVDTSLVNRLMREDERKKSNPLRNGKMNDSLPPGFTMPPGSAPPPGLQPPPQGGPPPSRPPRKR
ncbi:MAG: efflux RND transporter periplasmic adaptor subunit [Bacteroidales bacterium]|nr:efflux RND transporter periplasmic adaptor subunit [Lentimicrobiaceae bacterium]MDD5694793.1 efflux RND transporter periplasmic adaptor subunit [Bacteroidales bacterium]